MIALTIASITKSFGRHRVLDRVDLKVPAGAIVALLGKSGCGKTTLLRAIAGFDVADSGRIVFEGRVLDDNGRGLPAEKRQIGYVPQEGCLFPHLNVAGNVGFGLRRRERRGPRIAEILALTGLTGLEARLPHQLSGGQQQRTALARALAPRPSLLLLDEPFNALDMALRRSLCTEVMALLRMTGATAILVTHDPQEAFASANFVAVMREGRVAQFGTPAEVYRDPIDPDIARLTGPSLFFSAREDGNWAITALGRIPIGTRHVASGHQRLIMLRAEQLVIAADSATPHDGTTPQPGMVTMATFHGDHTLLTVRLGPETYPVRTNVAGITAGTPVQLRVLGNGVLFGSGGSTTTGDAADIRFGHHAARFDAQSHEVL